MIKFFLHINLLVLVSCGSVPRKSLESQVRSSKNFLMKEKPISSEADAKNYIQNQLNFLNLLYQQSRDPYYGQPKWSEFCLRSTKIGKVEVTEKYIWSVSELYMNAAGEFGHCPESPKVGRWYFILLYCKNKNKVVHDMRMQIDHKLDFEKLELCP